VSGKRGLAHTNGVRTQKLNGTKKSSRRLLTRSQATPNLPERLGGPPFPPRTPQSFGGGLPLRALLAAEAGLVVLAPMVVVAASLGAASLAAAAESVASEKTVAPPPASPAAVGIAAEVLEPGRCSAPRLRRLLALGGWLPHEGAVMWQGWPRSHLPGSLRRHLAVPDPFPGEREVWAPEASPDGQAQRGLAPTRCGAGPPGGSGPLEARPEHPVLVGTWRRRTYMSTGGRSGDHDPSCQARTFRHVTHRTRERSRITLRPSGWRPCKTTY
jgi:hypothetical protein